MNPSTALAAVLVQSVICRNRQEIRQGQVWLTVQLAITLLEYLSCHTGVYTKKTHSHYVERQDSTQNVSPPPILLSTLLFVTTTRTSYFCMFEKYLMREIGVSRP